MTIIISSLNHPMYNILPVIKFTFKDQVISLFKVNKSISLRAIQQFWNVCLDQIGMDIFMTMLELVIKIDCVPANVIEKEREKWGSADDVLFRTGLHRKVPTMSFVPELSIAGQDYF